MKITPNTLFYVTETRSSKKEIRKQFSMYFPESRMNTCNVIFEKAIQEKSVYVTEIYFFRDFMPKLIMHVIFSG